MTKAQQKYYSINVESVEQQRSAHWLM